MTRTTPPLQQHLLTRSDLARMGVPAAQILDWLAASTIEQVGALGEAGDEDPVFTVAGPLRAELLAKLATIGKDTVVLSPLRVRSFLLRAMLPRDAATTTEPEPVTADALPEPDLADVLHEAAKGIQADVEAMLQLAAEEARLEAAAMATPAAAAPATEPTEDLPGEPARDAAVAPDDAEAEGDEADTCFDFDDLASELDGLLGGEPIAAPKAADEPEAPNGSDSTFHAEEPEVVALPDDDAPVAEVAHVDAPQHLEFDDLASELDGLLGGEPIAAPKVADEPAASNGSDSTFHAAEPEVVALPNDDAPVAEAAHADAPQHLEFDDLASELDGLLGGEPIAAPKAADELAAPNGSDSTFLAEEPEVVALPDDDAPVAEAAHADAPQHGEDALAEAPTTSVFEPANNAESVDFAAALTALDDPLPKAHADGAVRATDELAELVDPAMQETPMPAVEPEELTMTAAETIAEVHTDVATSHETVETAEPAAAEPVAVVAPAEAPPTEPEQTPTPMATQSTNESEPEAAPQAPASPESSEATATIPAEPNEPEREAEPAHVVEPAESTLETRTPPSAEASAASTAPTADAATHTTIAAPATTPVAQAAADGEVQAALATTHDAMQRVESFLDQLKGALVEMAQRPSTTPLPATPTPPPAVDVAPLVAALQAGFDRSAQQSAATSAALAALTEKIGNLGENMGHGVQQVLTDLRKQPQPAERQASELIITRSDRTPVAMFAVAALVLAWSALFWFKTGSTRLALGTLVGANLVGCCLLTAWRRRF